MDRAEALEWKNLVSNARRDVGKFAALLGALDRILKGLARRLAGTDADDALQAAHIAIWQALPKVDLRRTRGIRAMLITTGVHAMRDERRRRRRQTRGLERPGVDPTASGTSARTASSPAPTATWPACGARRCRKPPARSTAPPANSSPPKTSCPRRNGTRLLWRGFSQKSD